MEIRTRLGLLLTCAALLGAGPATAQGKTPAAPAAAPAPETIARGDTLFHKSGLCFACHGTNAQGGVGPNLTDADWIHGDGSLEMIVATVTKGIPKEAAKTKVAMPPKGGSSISDEEVKAVAAYVWSLSHK